MSQDELKKLFRHSVVPSSEFRALNTHVCTLNVSVSAQAVKNLSDIAIEDLRAELERTLLRKLTDRFAVREFLNALQEVIHRAGPGMSGGYEAYDKLRKLAFRVLPEYLRDEEEPPSVPPDPGPGDSPRSHLTKIRS